MRDTRLPRKRASSLPNRLWTFVNTSFGLWLMSAIFIYGTGASFAWWHERAEKRTEARARAERLDLEISYRLTRIFDFLQRKEGLMRMIRQHEAMRDSPWVAKTLLLFETSSRAGVLTETGTKKGLPPGFEKQLSREAFLKKLDAKLATFRAELTDAEFDISQLVNSPPPTYFPALYPEYASSNLASLLTQLRDHVNPSERAAIDSSLTFLTPFYATDINTAAKRLQTSVVLERWRRHFDIPNCPGNPLCLAEESSLLPTPKQKQPFEPDLPFFFMMMATFGDQSVAKEADATNAVEKHPPKSKPTR